MVVIFEKKTVTLFLVFLTFIYLFIGCGDSNNSKKSTSTISDSLANVIDSIQLTNLHKSFVGIHAHGKDLAEHAHQDPKKKRRWRKKQARGVEAKKIAAKKRNLEREKMLDSLNSIPKE